MINLLPTDQKTDLRYARLNGKLVPLLTGLGLGILGILFIVVSGLWFLNQNINNQKAVIANQTALLTQQKQPETVKRVQEMSDSLKLATTVLSHEILFSELMRQIGTVMPPGTVLQSLQLSSDLNGSLDLTAGAVDYKSATQVQVNLQDPNNKIFDKADIVNINCTTPTATGTTASAYPCQVTIKALFEKNTPFLLLSTDKGTK